MNLPTVSLGQMAIHGIDVRLMQELGHWIKGRDFRSVVIEASMRVNRRLGGAYDAQEVMLVQRLDDIPAQYVAQTGDHLLAQRIRHIVHDMVKHEVDEWLTVNGVRVVEDPHAASGRPR